jgi:hypothetical protein
MQQHSMILTILIFLSLTCFAEPATWQGSLLDGSRIAIDSDTNKVTRTANGVSSPLWDGVHTLSNGTVITVREGIVVKDVAILEAQQKRVQERLNAACQRLVQKVCGKNNECGDDPACDPARQLMVLEQEELNEHAAGTVLESSSFCLEGLYNGDFFQACDKSSENTQTICKKLQIQVCGSDDQCLDREACHVVKQLVSMEQQDRFRVPSGFTYASAQCRDQLESGSEYFRVCEQE